MFDAVGPGLEGRARILLRAHVDRYLEPARVGLAERRLEEASLQSRQGVPGEAGLQHQLHEVHVSPRQFPDRAPGLRGAHLAGQQGGEARHVGEQLGRMATGRGDGRAGEEDPRPAHGRGGNEAAQAQEVVHVVGQGNHRGDPGGQVGLEVVHGALPRALDEAPPDAAGTAQMDVGVEEARDQEPARDVLHASPGRERTLGVVDPDLVDAVLADHDARPFDATPQTVEDGPPAQDQHLALGRPRLDAPRTGCRGHAEGRSHEGRPEERQSEARGPWEGPPRRGSPTRAWS